VSKSDRCACLVHLWPTFLQLRNSAKYNRNSILTQIDRGEQLCLLTSPTDALASSYSEIDNRTSSAQRLRRAMCLLPSPTDVLASSNSAKTKTHNWTSISKEEEEEERQQQQDRLSCDARNLNSRLTETTRGSPGRKSDLPMSTPWTHKSCTQGALRTFASDSCKEATRWETK
jgi:hypothetical protein